MSSDDDSDKHNNLSSSDSDDTSVSSRSSNNSNSSGSSKGGRSTKNIIDGDKNSDTDGGDDKQHANDNNNNTENKSNEAGLAFDFDEVQRRRAHLIAARKKLQVIRSVSSSGMLDLASAAGNNNTSTSTDGTLGLTSDGTGTNNNTMNNNATTRRAKKKKIKRNVVIARPKNPEDITPTKAQDINNVYSFFGFNQTATPSKDNDTNTDKASSLLEDDDFIYEDADVDNMKPIDIGKRKIHVWPYDDYHVTQSQFYKTIRSLKMDELSDQFTIRQNMLQKIRTRNQRTRRKLKLADAEKKKSKRNSSIATIDEENEKTDDNDPEQVEPTSLKRSKSIDDCLIEHQQNSYYSCENATMPVFTRQHDPPDLSRQVKGLNLDLFGEVALERSISIINTWMFDVGLIDELLTNGGATNLNAVVQQQNKNNPDEENDANITSSSTKRNRRRDTMNNRYKNKNKGKSSRSDDSADEDHDNDDDDHHDENDINPKDLKNSEQSDSLNNHSEITKMDKEMNRLRNATRRQLALVNARLKDGMMAIGSEVEALVNAVIITKEDIGRLREVSDAYSNDDGDQNGNTSQQFMLTKYPKLKQAINARKNLKRVFRDIDDFATIPVTCDRLREEMHAGEWTEYEWSSLRSVAREHADLEIFLVEAESVMKKMMEQEEAELQAQLAAKNKRKGGDKNRYNNNAQVTLPNSNSYALIDRFLERHVENVWEMGEEISTRIMNGIGAAYDLAMINPAGMVALVEAVEIYESANDSYKTVHGEEANKRNYKLKFTDMRAIALAGVYRDFETRCSDVFIELLAQATEIAKEGDDEEASNKQFSAILRAANELSSLIMIVKERMAPCFPDNWAITTLFTTCVAHICSQHILQQIGGIEGNNLPDLSLKQLLDLIAWVETFRATTHEIFPHLAKVTASKRSYENNAPKLLVENSKTIDIALAEDSLVWVNATLWNIHNVAKDEFLFKTKEMAEVWLERGYCAEREVTQSSDGRYRTAFCEDVYSMTSIHLRTIRERLTRQSEALVLAVKLVFQVLLEKQTNYRDNFCTDFETCCAAANDFLRMSDLCENMIDEIKNECNLTSKSAEILDEKSAALLGLFSSDAVHASKKTQLFCMQVIEDEVMEDIFTVEWEEELTENEIASGIVRTLDECMEDLEKGLDELMLNKAAEAHISAAINVYIKCLLVKGSKHTDSKNSMFKSNVDAIERMKDDAQVLRSYFDDVAEDIPTLRSNINDEFSFLEVIFDLLSIAAGLSNCDVKECITMLYKRLQDSNMTKFIVGDLWHIVNPAEEKNIYVMFDEMVETLGAIEQTELSNRNATGRSAVPDLQIENVISQYIEADSRKRPLPSDSIKKAQAALRSWTFMGGAKPKPEEPAKKEAENTDPDNDAEDDDDSDGEDDDEEE